MTAVFQAMLYFHGLHVARLAAAQGLTATEGLSGSTVAGRARASNVLSQLGNPLSGAQITASRTPALVRVEITGRVPTLIPGFTVHVHAVAVGPVSDFRP